MDEIIFVVEEAPEGGFIARALGHACFTEAVTWAELAVAAREAVACHFDDVETPRVIRLTPQHGGEHHVTIPLHRPLRIGTVAGILKEVADHLGIDRDVLERQLF